MWRLAGEHYRKTNEPVLFDLRRGRARPDWRDWRGWVGPVRPFYVLGAGMPVRGSAVGFLLGFTGVVLADRFQDPTVQWIALFVSVVLLVLPMFVELAQRRDFVTPTRFVHQYGLLGGVREEIPLATIERLEFDYSRYWPAGEAWGVGDLRIHTPGRVTTIAGIPHPDVAAQAIQGHSKRGTSGSGGRIGRVGKRTTRLQRARKALRG